MAKSFQLGMPQLLQIPDEVKSSSKLSNANEQFIDIFSLHSDGRYFQTPQSQALDALGLLLEE